MYRFTVKYGSLRIFLITLAAGVAVVRFVSDITEREIYFQLPETTSEAILLITPAHGDCIGPMGSHFSFEDFEKMSKCRGQHHSLKP
jgi:hypothetical protein